MPSLIEAATHDARAVLSSSTSLRDCAVALHKEHLISAHVLEAVEAMHAEVLRASHLMTTAAALHRHSLRGPTS
jgi:hypothetical protein